MTFIVFQFMFVHYVITVPIGLSGLAFLLSPIDCVHLLLEKYSQNSPIHESSITGEIGRYLG